MVSRHVSGMILSLP